MKPRMKPVTLVPRFALFSFLPSGLLCLGHPHDTQQQPPVLALNAAIHWHHQEEALPLVSCRQLGHSIRCNKKVTCSWTFIAAFLLPPLWQKLRQISITLKFLLFPQHLQVSVLCRLYMSCDIPVLYHSPPPVRWPAKQLQLILSLQFMTWVTHSPSPRRTRLSVLPLFQTSPANSFCLALCCLRRLAVSTRMLYNVHCCTGFPTCNAIPFIWNISVAVNLDMSNTVDIWILRILNKQGKLFLSQYRGPSGHEAPPPWLTLLCWPHPSFNTCQALVQVRSLDQGLTLKPQEWYNLLHHYIKWVV